MIAIWLFEKVAYRHGRAVEKACACGCCRPIAQDCFSQAQLAFIEEFYSDTLQGESTRHGVRVYCGSTSILARGKLFRMEVGLVHKC